MSEKTIEEIVQLFTFVSMGVTRRVINFKYKDKKIGRLIFLVNYIGFKGGCTIKELIHYLNVKPSTATRQLDKLVDELGLVRRFQSKKDRRVINLELTDVGWEAYKHHKTMTETLTKAIMKDANKDELEVIRKALEKVVEAYS